MISGYVGLLILRTVFIITEGEMTSQNHRIVD
jgi:hypothetical protein